MLRGRSWIRAIAGPRDPARKARSVGVLDTAWQAYLFPQSERVAAVGRLAVVALTVGWWFAAQHERPAMAGSVPVAVVAATILLATAVVTVVVLARPQSLERVPFLGVAADFVLVLAWLLAMGPRAAGPFLPLVVVASASDATRVPLWGGTLSSLAYAALALRFGGPAASVLAGYTLIVGLGMAVFSMGVHHDRLRSMRDPLTGVYSRRWGLYQVQRLISQASYPFCIAFVDLDNFKMINDVHGHLVGDQALATLATLMQAHLRQVDTVVRMGGDEFMVILPHTDVVGARGVAERMRAVLEEARLDVPGDGRHVRATASIGLVEAMRGASLHSLIERADACLYEAKRKHNTIVSSAG